MFKRGVMELKTIYADLLPPLSTEEFEALRADIEINGVHTPVMIDEDCNILDGHHRYKIDNQAPTTTITGLSSAEKIAFVLSSNMKRRNLSPEQKKRVREKMQGVAVELKKEGKTQEFIAAALGIGRSTVSGWLDEKGTIVSADNGSLDARVVIPKEADDVILDRLDSGETQAQIAADFGVTRRAIGKRAKKARKKKEKKQAAETPQPVVEKLESDYQVSAGDVWVLGRHKLICGSAYDYLEEYRSAALITDPPYGIDYKPDWNKWDGSPTDYSPVIGDDKPFDPRPFMDHPTVLLFGANYYSDRLPVGGWLVWDKRLDVEKDNMIGSPFELAWYRSENTTRKAIMVRVLHGGVVNADSKNGNNEKRYHSTQKPVAVMEQIVELLTRKGDLVLDPFSGSGSTLLACEKKGRDCIAIEIDPEYVATTLKRWEQETGILPIKEEG